MIQVQRIKFVLGMGRYFCRLSRLFFLLVKEDVGGRDVGVIQQFGVVDGEVIVSYSYSVYLENQQV